MMNIKLNCLIASFLCTHLLASADVLLPPPLAPSAQMDALSILPPEQVVRRTLENLPRLRSFALQVDLAQTEKSRLEAGNHEWTVRAGSNTRTDQSGARFNEQELALERSLRWFGKAGKDRAIGEKGIFLAEVSHADGWHEASRALMKDWFDAIREITASRRLSEQLDIAQQLRQSAEKRVKSGAAAQLELLQADTESRRVGALLQQAQLRQEQALHLLSANYPGLPQPAAGTLPLPYKANETPAFWIHMILHDNHEIELAQAEADLFFMQAKRSASNAMPDPTLGLRAGRERNGQERIVGFSLAIALPGAARSAETSGANLKARIVMEKLEQTKITVTAAAQRAVLDSLRSHDLWQTMQHIQRQSEQQAGTMMSAYKLGEASLTDALNTRRLALDAVLAAQAAQIDALAAFARVQLDAHRIWSID